MYSDYGRRKNKSTPFKELNEKGEVVTEGFNHSSTVSIEFVGDKKAKKKLIGLKPKDELVIDPKVISRGDADMASMLGIDKDRAKLYNRNVLLTVNEVKTLEPANVDVALFDKIYGAGEIKTEDEFRQKIISDLGNMFTADTDRIFKTWPMGVGDFVPNHKRFALVVGIMSERAC